MKAKMNTPTLGHLAALITILIWGTTFISTKVLLNDFTPIEILFARFLIGFVVLLLVYPRRLVLQRRRQEWLFVAAGASGIALYYLLENVALTLTSASNVGVIITIAPFFTALLSFLFLRQEKPRWLFFAGFLAAIVGVGLISYSGSRMRLNPMGDLLALLAALAWAVYAILTRKISALGHHPVQATRRVFFYGLLFMLPLLFLLFLMDFRLGFERFANPVNTGNILFLGLGASALCFVTWNTAVGILGAVKTSVYIYLVPVVTVTASVLLLGEPLTPALVIGALLTLAGLWLSEMRRSPLLRRAQNNKKHNRC